MDRLFHVLVLKLNIISKAVNHHVVLDVERCARELHLFVSDYNLDEAREGGREKGRVIVQP